MAYIVKADVANFLGVTLSTKGQGIVDSLIPAIEDTVDIYCNRSWKTANATTNITEKFDGGVDVFFVANPKINSIISVTIEGEAYDLDGVYNYGTHIKLADKPVPGLQTVVIVYRTDANLTNIPASIKQAIIQWIAEMFKASPDAGKVAKDVQFGATKISYKTSEDDMPDYVRRVLDLYRIIPL